MRKYSFKPVASAVALFAATACMQVSAAPTFTIDPSAIPGNVFANTPFDATLINGTTSELLHLDAVAETVTATSGWAELTSFSNGPVAVGSLISGLGDVDYRLYLTFDLTASLTSGTFGAANSVYDLTSLNVQVWADPSQDTTFTFADAPTATEATVAGGGNDILLAASTLLTGVSGFNSLGGAFINSVSSFAVCTGAGTADVGGVAIAMADCADGTGSSYFAAPVPFYSVSFGAFNNTTQGIIRDGDLISINNAVGIIDFAGVPEPGSIALVGLALLGVGATSMRRRSA